MEEGTRVMTIDGPGTIKGKDLPDCNCWRYAIKLDNDPYKYESGTVCYYEKEVKPIGANQ